MRCAKLVVLAGPGGTAIDMTGVTACGGGHGAVVVGGRQKAFCCVADPAVLARQKMAKTFTSCKYVVMTGLAVACDTGMIKGCRYKARGEMTFAAIFTGRYMVGELAFGDNTVMTLATVSHDTRVIILGAGKGGGVMTNRAILLGGQMFRRFNRRCRYRTIVTG